MLSYILLDFQLKDFVVSITSLMLATVSSTPSRGTLHPPPPPQLHQMLSGSHPPLPVALAVCSLRVEQKKFRFLLMKPLETYKFHVHHK
jgi:hypothetical protein